MSEADRTRAIGSASGDHEGGSAALGSADWLCLAATPTFAILAVLTGVFGGGPLDALCSAAHDASPLHGMVLMYALMSAFHSAPWLRLVSRRRLATLRGREPSGARGRRSRPTPCRERMEADSPA